MNGQQRACDFCRTTQSPVDGDVNGVLVFTQGRVFTFHPSCYYLHASPPGAS